MHDTDRLLRLLLKLSHPVRMSKFTLGQNLCQQQHRHDDLTNKTTICLLQTERTGMGQGQSPCLCQSVHSLCPCVYKYCRHLNLSLSVKLFDIKKGSCKCLKIFRKYVKLFLVNTCIAYTYVLATFLQLMCFIISSQNWN